jgi:hypothetical protein
MTDQGELSAIARAVIDANLYLTLGTVDESGRPWLSPVYFVAHGYREFYWASKTDTRHSRNLAVRPELSIVIFDSAVPVYQGRAVFVDAVGAEVPEAELDAGIEIYNGPAARRNASVLARADVTGPAPYRLYRARASRQYTLDPAGHDLRVPVDL